MILVTVEINMDNIIHLIYKLFDYYNNIIWLTI